MTLFSEETYRPPFAILKKMDPELISRWNKRVGVVFFSRIHGRSADWMETVFTFLFLVGTACLGGTLPEDRLVITAATRDRALLRGRAAHPELPFWWSGGYVEFRDEKGNPAGRYNVTRDGYFFATIPQGKDLSMRVVDREGTPLSEPGEVLEETGCLAFVPLQQNPMTWWVEGKTTRSGLTFSLRACPDVKTPPEVLAVFVPSSDESRSRFMQLTRKLFENRPCWTVWLDLGRDDRIDRAQEEAVVRLLDSLLEKTGLDPARCLLISEKERTLQVLHTASVFRDRVGGVLVWEGEPGNCLIPDLVTTPVAILGKRENLGPLTEWSGIAEGNGCPVFLESYWSDPTDWDLETDLRGAIDWLSSTGPRQPTRVVEHQTYLPLYGRYQWIWVTRLDRPGKLGVVRAHWLRGSVIQLNVTNVSGIRVRLDTPFRRKREGITIVLEETNLPVPLAKMDRAVELIKDPETGDWGHSYVNFEDPPEPVPVAVIPESGFNRGDDLPGFAAFLQTELGVDCAWGYRWETSVRSGIFSDLDLYRSVRAVPYAVVEWPASTAREFHRWRRDRFPENPVEATCLQTGKREDEQRSHGKLLRCAVEVPLVKTFFESFPDRSAEYEDINRSRRELVGMFLGKRYD